MERKSPSLSSLSIVVPSYNQGKYLGQCLDSICSQLCKHDELFVIDGGSEDDTLKIIRRFKKHITFWRSAKDEGHAWAINFGMELCTNPIVAWINADDYYLPGAFDFVREHFSVDQYDMIYGDTEIVDRGGSLLWRRYHGFWDPYRLIHGDYDIDQQACFWSRSWWHSLGGLDEELFFCLDLERHYRDAVAGVRAKHFPKFLAAYRLHPETKTANYDEIRRRELQQLKSIYQPQMPISRVDYLVRSLRRRLYILTYSRGAVVGWKVKRRLRLNQVYKSF